MSLHILRLLSPALVVAAALHVHVQGAPHSQGRQQQAAKFKGIFEPVSFSEPIRLSSVHFVSDDEGWAVGDKGTIIYTNDGGKTWTAQMGGDPAASEEAFADVRFIDRTTGWVVGGAQDTVQRKLLGTRDGKTWQQVGVVGQPVVKYRDYTFTSPTTGVSIDERGQILQTTDGGKSWKQVGACQAKVNIGGVFKNVGCALKRVRFVNANVGFASGGGEGATPVVMKTTDGGATWSVVYAEPGIAHHNEFHLDQSLAFLSEKDGLLRLANNKLLTTADGGATWAASPTAIEGTLAFADDQVGWAISGYSRVTLSYTTNGGKSWNKRQLAFPASVNALTMPSRQRGYVVGDSGMVFRYRVVPADYKAPNIIEAPAMPGR